MRNRTVDENNRCANGLFKQDLENILSSKFSTNRNPECSKSFLDAAKLFDLQNNSTPTPNISTPLSESNAVIDRIDSINSLSNPLAGKPFFTSKVSQLLRDYYGNLDQQCSLPQIFLPFGELLLQQLHLHFRKLQSVAEMAKNMSSSTENCDKVPLNLKFLYFSDTLWFCRRTNFLKKV